MIRGIGEANQTDGFVQDGGFLELNKSYVVAVSKRAVVTLVLDYLFYSNVLLVSKIVSAMMGTKPTRNQNCLINDTFFQNCAAFNEKVTIYILNRSQLGVEPFLR